MKRDKPSKIGSIGWQWGTNFRLSAERGGSQHLIFDNRMLWNHRALAAALGVILLRLVMSLSTEDPEIWIMPMMIVATRNI